MTLITGLGIFPVPSGDWDANMFASYLNTVLPVGYSITFDQASLCFTFSTAVEILEGTTCQRLLGLPEGFVGTMKSSSQPVNFTTVAVINVDTNLSLYNAPVSGRLASIPVTGFYGDQIQYFDSSGSLPVLMMNHQLSTFEITLTNQDGEEIMGYEDIPWTMTIEMQEVPGQIYDTLFERL